MLCTQYSTSPQHVVQVANIFKVLRMRSSRWIIHYDKTTYFLFPALRAPLELLFIPEKLQSRVKKECSSIFDLFYSNPFSSHTAWNGLRNNFNQDMKALLFEDVVHVQVPGNTPVFFIKSPGVLLLALVYYCVLRMISFPATYIWCFVYNRFILPRERSVSGPGRARYNSRVKVDLCTAWRTQHSVQESIWWKSN